MNESKPVDDVPVHTEAAEQSDAIAQAQKLSCGDSSVDLKHPLNALMFGLFWTLALVVFLQFVTRYLLNSSLAWTEEIARYLLIVTVFLGGALASRRRAHIAVEVLREWLPSPLRRVLVTSTYVITLCFLIVCTLHAVQLALTTRQRMVTIDVSKAVMYWFVAAGFAGMVFYTAKQMLAKTWMNKENPSSKNNH